MGKVKKMGGPKLGVSRQPKVSPSTKQVKTFKGSPKLSDRRDQNTPTNGRQSPKGYKGAPTIKQFGPTPRKRGNSG